MMTMGSTAENADSPRQRAILRLVMDGLDGAADCEAAAEEVTVDAGAAAHVDRPRPSFSAVFSQELAYVLRSLRRLGAREADLEDLAQDVFVTVHHRYESYDPARPIRPWLFAFVFRTVANHRRGRARRPETPLESVEKVFAPIDESNPETQALRVERQTLVLEALQDLTDDQRAAFILHELDGQTAPEIAAALEVPLNTIYSRIRLGKAAFVKAVRTRAAGGGT